MTLGSDSGCQLVLPDEEVAPKHALIEDRGEGGLHIRDLGTMHKILVNSRETRQSRLKHGDMVEIGRTRFLVQAVVAAVVSGKDAQERERFSSKLYVAAAAVLVLGVVTWWRWPDNHPQVGPPKAEPDLSVQVPESSTNESPKVSVEEPPQATPSRRMTAADFSNAMAQVVFPAASNGEQTNQVAAEIQKMRAELDAMHEKIKSVAPQTAPPEPPKIESVISVPAIIASVPALLVTTSSLPAAVNTNNSSPVSYVAQNGQPPTNLPERPPPVAVTNYAPEVASIPVAPAATGRLLRVLNVEQSRFPASDEYDDMRNFNIILSLVNPRYEIGNSDVKVDLIFYDEDLSTGTIKPSASVEPITAMHPSQSWGSDRRSTISATYLLPKGARAKEKSMGHESRYYGFSVRVTFQGQLQDEWALPKSLLTNIAINSATTVKLINSEQASALP